MVSYSKLLNIEAEPELCDAAEVSRGSTYAAVIRSLIGIVTLLRTQAKQPIGVNVRFDNGDRAQKILSDHTWLGAYPSPQDLEFLVATGVILPRASYGEETIKRAHDDATRDVIRKLMADDDGSAKPTGGEQAKLVATVDTTKKPS
jgi:hypothetical protein